MTDQAGEDVAFYPGFEGEVRCVDCRAVWDDEDDLQQVQPDGRYACPLHDVGSDEGALERVEAGASS